VEATVNMINEKELRQEIDRYSKAVEIAFADEIKGLYDSGRKDRVLFLSFIFISQYIRIYNIIVNEFKINFIKQEYEKLKEENFESFERILMEEYRVKVGNPLLTSIFDKEKILEFSHPSYSNALTHILKHPGCEKIFWNVLKDLADKKDTAGNVVGAIVYNFNKLPKNIQDLIFELVDNEYAANYVAIAILNNFNKLPKNIQDLIFELVDKDYVTGEFVWAIIRDLYNLPVGVRNLIFKDKSQQVLKEYVYRISNLKSEDYIHSIEEYLKIIIDKNFKQKILQKLENRR
jgi:hypothetical protein